MSQYARPDSDVVVSGWTTAPLSSKVNEAVVNDSPYIVGVGVDTCELGLSDVASPGAGDQILRVRSQRGAGGATGTAYLFDGAVEICSLTMSATTSFVTVSHTLTVGEKAAIGDYTDLRVKLSSTANNKAMNVSWVEFQTPDEAAVPLTIDKSDSVTITEDSTVIIPTLFVDESDSIIITEDSTILIPTLYINVSDSITITEDSTVLILTLYIDSSDSITITESADISETNYISVSDAITITETESTPVVDSYSEVNADGGVSIGNVITKLSQSFTGDGGVLHSAKFYLYKLGSPTGNAVVKIYAHSGVFGTSSVPTGSALATSEPFDVATLTGSEQLITFTFTGGEKITLTNGVKYCLVLEYSDGGPGDVVFADYDTSSPTHAGNYAQYIASWSPASGTDFVFYVYRGSVSILTSTPTIDISDSITATEAVTVFFPVLYINVSDSVTVTEDSTVQLSSVELDINVSDSVTITESVTARLTNYIGVSDSVTITEDSTVQLLTVALNINVGDSITITDVLPEYVPEEITITDTSTVDLPATALLSIDVSDSITITESSIVAVSGPQISVFDSITVTETSTADIGIIVNVFDLITITEDETVTIVGPPAREINVSDSITITDVSTLSIVALNINVSDSITITEGISVLLPFLSVDVGDSVVISEAVSVLIPTIFASVSDLITITESVSYQTQLEGWLYTPEAPGIWTEEDEPVTSWAEESEPTSPWTEEAEPETSWAEESETPTTWTEE